ncbi:MAG: DUF1294 domain-containing protein, partial [Chloroflexi bacterium]|nr:DUF1294 domain-containing protein [Chloroflexota bacterium]
TSKTHFVILIFLCIVAGALAYLAFATFQARYITWLAFWSVVTFSYYGFDKWQAGRNGWRVPELVLHSLALLGGFVGGWLGRMVFHHKTRKPLFTWLLLLSSALHLGFYLIWFR